MRALTAPTAVFVLLPMGLLCFGEGSKEPTYISGKPLYARVALGEEGSRILLLAFDESGGTGEGYDTIHADVNFNGDLTDDKATKGTLKRRGSTTTCSFPLIDVDVPHNEKGKGVENPCQVRILYYQHKAPVGRSEQGATQLERFLLWVKIRLKNKTGEWEYSGFAGRVVPEGKGEEIPVVAAIGEKPLTLTVEARPDRDKRRHLGVAAHLRSGTWSVSCARGNSPIKAHVQIRNRRGKLVHSQPVRSDKLFFG